MYLTARFKREKRLIASSIVSEIRAMNPPGRFLARKGNKDSGFWYDIGDEKARDKTSQALRENAPTIRAEIETEINEQRAEIQRHETEDQAHYPAPAPPPHHGHPFFQQPPPPPQHPSHQAYWDWYHHYYGYPPSTPGVPPHYPPHPQHPAPVHAVPGAVASNPAQAHAHHANYWGHSVIPAGREKNTGEEAKSDGANLAHMMSQEDEDHLLALQLQQEEKAALYEDRKNKHKHSLARRSNAHLGAAARAPAASHVRRPEVASSPYQPIDSFGSKQEEHDRRLAASLQAQENEEVARSRSTKTSRSMAFPQFNRAGGESSHEHSFSESFMAWMHGDSKPKAEPRRTVQFKDNEMSGSHFSHSAGTLQRQSSTASADRPLQPQATQNPSLLYQAAKGIIGWDAKNSHQSNSEGHYILQNEDMETEGLEVQLRDPNEETTMPPPDPRVQTEWSSRSINSWIPEHINTNLAANGHRDHSLSGHIGISPSHSLEMDTSANAASVGGGSLCHLFDQDESLQRALRGMPSWERSMRSRSPLSFNDDSDLSMIRVRELRLFKAPPPPIKQSNSGDMDWED